MEKIILTKKQKSLIKELDDIFSMFDLDYKNVKDVKKEFRTAYLQIVKDQIVRSQIIIFYTLIDEFLNVRLCNYFFGNKRSFIELWKTKKFQNFNYHILEELSLLQKLRFVKATMKIPKGIVNDIERFNSLRNGIAHAFFPENLKKSKPVWKGKNVFTLEGLEILIQDMEKMRKFFFKYLSN